MSNGTVDPMAAAMDPPARPRSYFGKINASATFVVLQKGAGKVPFNPNTHSASQKRTAVKLSITTNGRNNEAYQIERDCLAEQNDIGWMDVTLPSLKRLGVVLSDINDHYGQAELVETGETYDKEQFDERGRSTGWKTVKKTALKFVALFPNEAACRAAADVFYGEETEQHLAEGAASVKKSSGGSLGGSPFKENGNSERGAAAQMLVGLWGASNNNRERFAKFIQADDNLSKYFTMESQEVLNVMEGRAPSAMREEPLPEVAKSARAQRNVPKAIDNDEDIPF